MAQIKDIFNKTGKKKFIVVANDDLLDMAMRLSEKYETLLYSTDASCKNIGKGLVKKIEDDWFNYIGQGYTWVFAGCEMAKMQDWLRENAEAVVGTNEKMVEYEEDRQKGQEWFKELGFNQPKSENFIDFDNAIEYVEKSDKRLILKQNGSAPKHLNHKGKFEDGYDMIWHIEELKKSWNNAKYGEIDFDLMEIVEGMEVSAVGFFNGKEFLKNADGKIVGFLTWEHKKESDGDLGETCGETGTIFIGVDEDQPLFKDILLRPGIIKKLKETNYRGMFDINGSLTEKGYVAFEPTCRFGIPESSYIFMEGLKADTGELLDAMARGKSMIIDVEKSWGIAQVVSAKPFPVDAELPDEDTSLGVRLWPLKNGKRSDDFTVEQMKHIHLDNFEKDGECYKVATKNGYLLVVTQKGKSIAEARENALEFIKENIYIQGMKYRQDVGESVEEKI